MTAEGSVPGQGGPADPAAALAGRLFHDVSGALELFTVYLGERLGFYRALARHGLATSAELAGRTGTTERYVREWLEHELVADQFTAPPPTWSVTTTAGAWGHACRRHGDPGTAATGAVMRPATLDRYARPAGFGSVHVLPLRTRTWRFYRLIP